MLKLLVATAGWREPSKCPELQGSSQGQEEEDTQISSGLPLGLLTLLLLPSTGVSRFAQCHKTEPRHPQSLFGTQQCPQLPFPLPGGLTVPSVHTVRSGCHSWSWQVLLRTVLLPWPREHPHSPWGCSATGEQSPNLLGTSNKGVTQETLHQPWQKGENFTRVLL